MICISWRLQCSLKCANHFVNRARRYPSFKVLEKCAMKRVFFASVIAYSAAIFLLNDLGSAVGHSGTTALPWMAKCLIDICFAGAAFFAMFGDQIEWDDDEEGIHPDDVTVPSTWLYGLFGVNLLANFGWHGYEFAVLNGAESLYNAAWFFVEFLGMGITLILFKHAQQTARRAARAAQKATKPTPFERRC
jgi:hypothetical protein